MIVLTNSSLQESETGKIDMKDDDPEAVHELMKYLYTLEFSSEDESLPKNLNVLRIADKYSVTRLADQAFEHIVNGLEILDGTEMLADLVAAAYEEDAPEMVQKLRPHLTQVSATHFDLSEFKILIRELNRDFPEYGNDMMDELSERLEDEYQPLGMLVNVAEPKNRPLAICLKRTPFGD